MENILSWAVIYMLTIIVGYMLKQLGIAGEAMKKSISDLIFYVTLPALLISSFADVEADLWYLVCIGLGFLTNVFMVAVACIVSRNKSPELKGIYTINGAGYNMGNLAIPFLSNFYPKGIPYLCMFDVGDSFLTLGTTYAIASVRMKKSSAIKGREQLKAIGKSLVTSLSFDVYFLMTVLSFLRISLPQPVLDYAEFLGKGNSCLAMLLIGMTLDFKMSRYQLKEALTILGGRYFCGAVAAVLMYFVLPAPLIMRQILAAAVFTATPSAALIFTMKLGVSTEVAGILAPVSAVCMIPVMAVVMLLMGV